MSRSKLTLALAMMALFVPAFGQGINPGRPGALNYVEGQASIEGHQLSPRAIGRAVLQPGQYLATGEGKAEILLTPGIFLRLDKDSTVKMISPDLTRTEVEVSQGRASVEVDQIFEQNKILINLKNGQTQLLKTGLYIFDAANNTVRTFDGKALVFASVTPQPNEKPLELKGGREVTLTGELSRPVKFDKNKAKASDPLYAWSGLRSAYLGEENINLAESYAGAPGFAPGWFWDSAAYDYTWLPGDGLFWSPFGYGFYSPYYIYGGGFIYGGYHGGYPHPGHGGYPGHPGPGHGGNPGHGGAPAGGFRGGGGGGGFHGGGGGGGHR